MKKKIIAIIAVISMISMILTACSGSSSTGQNQITDNNIINEQVETTSNSEGNKKVSLTDIEKWYKNEMPAVSQNLIEYSNSVKGISNMNVTESKFRFGEEDGWYDCHYTYYFTCNVNGQKCTGEARAFRKYNDPNIDWFHFEITRDSDWATIVEEYDEASDATIENYYKELVAQYK